MLRSIVATCVRYSSVGMYVLRLGPRSVLLVPVLNLIEAHPALHVGGDLGRVAVPEEVAQAVPTDLGDAHLVG